MYNLSFDFLQTLNTYWSYKQHNHHSFCSSCQETSTWSPSRCSGAEQDWLIHHHPVVSSWQRPPCPHQGLHCGEEEGWHSDMAEVQPWGNHCFNRDHHLQLHRRSHLPVPYLCYEWLWPESLPGGAWNLLPRWDWCLCGYVLLLYALKCFFWYLVCLLSSEPSAEIRRGLTNSAAVSGEEFSISVELSAVCSGFWSLNGRLLRSGADYLITRSKNTHTLLIRVVTMEMNGNEIKFVGGGSQSSCILSVKGMKTQPDNYQHTKML